MVNSRAGLVLAEPGSSYHQSSQQWVEVLVDFPGVQELLTHRLPTEI